MAYIIFADSHLCCQHECSHILARSHGHLTLETNEPRDAKPFGGIRGLCEPLDKEDQKTGQIYIYALTGSPNC